MKRRIPTVVRLLILLLIVITINPATPTTTATPTTAASLDTPPSQLADTNKTTIIAIDFGSHYTRVAFFHNDTRTTQLIPNDHGALATPTYVTWDAITGEPTVGQDAKQHALRYPHDTIFDFKRLLGHTFNSNQVQTAINTHLPYAIVDRDNQPMIQVRVVDEMREFSPQDITAIVLAKMKQSAETYLGHHVVDAVMTVPAYFNDAQRQAIQDAGIMAGLTIQRIINEPTAATIAHDIDKKTQGEQNVLVLDVGGGTSDVTLLSVDGGVFEVLATNRHISYAAGDAFDQRIIEYCVAKWRDDLRIDITTNPQALQQLRHEVERVKRVLSTQSEAVVHLAWSSSEVEGDSLTQTLSRTMFEIIAEDLAGSVLTVVGEVLIDGGIKASEVDEIVFVGGTTRIPKLRQMVTEFFDGKEASSAVGEEEAIVRGGAIQAGILSEPSDGTKDILTALITVLSLGIETAGGVMHRVVSRYTVCPTHKTRVFTTLHTNQTIATIRIFEGQRLLTRHNRLIGQLDLVGLIPAANGVAQIEISFRIDDKCESLEVSAHDTGSNVLSKTLLIPLDQNSMSSEELAAQVKDAGDAEEADANIKDQIDQWLAAGVTTAVATNEDVELNSARRSLVDAEGAVVAVVEHAPAAALPPATDEHDEL